MKTVQNVQNVLPIFDEKDLENLKRTCALDVKQILGGNSYRYVVPKGVNSSFVGVTHADTVQPPNKDTARVRNRVYGATLDNRLGWFTLAWYLPKYYGIIMPYYITNDEELGQSTLQTVKTLQSATLYAEFDIRGTYPTLYQSFNKDLYKSLKDVFGNIATGSYSDVYHVPFMSNMCGVNFPVGFEDYHTEYGYVDLSVYTDNIAKFAKFHALYNGAELFKNSDKYPMSGNHRVYSNYNSYYYGKYDTNAESTTLRIDGNDYTLQQIILMFGIKDYLSWDTLKTKLGKDVKEVFTREQDLLEENGLYISTNGVYYYV